MEFRNEVERWHKTKEFAEYLMKYAEFQELCAIGECVHYEWDNQSMEDYCWSPALRKHPFETMTLDGKSREICWKCLHYEVQSLGESANV